MNQRRLLDLFLEMVRIESLSRFEGAMAKRCEAELASLGFEVHFDNAHEALGSEVGNLIAYRAGDIDADIVLSAHMDTVAPCSGIEPIVENGIVRSKGDTILSADDKAGIAAIIEGVRSLIETGEALPNITVLFTVCEELSLLGSGALEQGELPEGAPCYVFDADGAPGTIILGSPCHYTLKAAFAGRAAHAGVEPEVGVSAIQMAADAIHAMNLGRLDEATTANIGIIQGGREANIVADSCTLVGECRSLFQERAEMVRESMEAAIYQAAQNFGGSAEIEWRADYGAILYNQDDPFVRNVAKAAAAADLAVSYRNTGGGSDANMLLACGVQAITLGVGMTNFHSVEEYISVEDLEGTTCLVKELIRACC